MGKQVKKYSGQSFARAAHKHLKTCDEMFSHLSAVRSEQDKKILLSQLYYISGYVLECIYKFGILSAMGKATVNLSKEELDELGLKSHDIRILRQEYIEYSHKKTTPIAHNHFKKWDVQIRYYAPNEIEELDFSKIKDYLLNCVKVEYNSIKSDY